MLDLPIYRSTNPHKMARLTSNATQPCGLSAGTGSAEEAHLGSQTGAFLTQRERASLMSQLSWHCTSQGMRLGALAVFWSAGVRSLVQTAR